jgi:tRNA-specific 2-thiouridylase
MADARRIASKLDIPFHVLDTRDVFHDKIVDFFVEGHRQGVTPMPCLECNRHIRFDWLLQNALALDADYLATGHYARIEKRGERYALLKGLDDAKDQSYVLSVMGQAQLSRVLFPVGIYPKPQVREIAARFGLPTASKGDSQDLCFLGDGDYRRFLREHAPEIMMPGPIVRKDGSILGEHHGLSNYTIGQRKGLGIIAREPMFVIGKNPYRNALIVGTADELGRRTLTAARMNWVAGAAPSYTFDAEVKIRYKAKPAAARITTLADDRIHAEFAESLRDITPGQGAVVYAGDEVLGGGIIERYAD